MENTSSTSFQFLVLLFLSSGILLLETIKLGFCCSESERIALLNFKRDLVDPSNRLFSWTGRDCCGWSGVTCHNLTGHVTKLRLGNFYPGDPDEGGGEVMALGGNLNPSLIELKHLRYLDLSMNNFGGIPIPSFIGSLETLRYVNLSGASFGGTIPPSLGNLSRLLYLDLNSYTNEPNDKNDLNWLPGLLSLKYLNLGGVDLSDAGANWFQAVSMLPSLHELHLPSCSLPNLPLFWPNLTSILVLDLSSNGLNSSIPTWLFNLTSLVYLDLNQNYLQGEVMDGFANLHSLQVLDLSENSYIGGKLSRNLGSSLCALQVLDLSFNIISGEITEFVDGLSECDNCSLESLKLAYNNMGGPLPNSLGNLQNLKYISLMQNSFSGPITETIGNLSGLEEFYLKNNQMETIPVSLGQLSSLVSMDFSENPWHGVITEAHFSNLTNLKELSISTNISLVINVHPEWNPPFKLTYLNLKSCLVGPEFPLWLRNQDELETVAIWKAGITGTIPDWFWKLGLFLKGLDFSYNQLTGTIPYAIRFQYQATVFLNHNLFSGPIPITLFSSNLSSLHLDNNFFSGPIPRDFGDRMPMLTEIDISYNSLNGSIPSSIGSINSLLTIRASDNHLSGEIPEIWNDIPEVYTIDFSNNSLSGEIPSSLGSLNSLMYLALSDNNLSGEIPSSLQNCTRLETLDLGDNFLSGNIPEWLGVKMPSLLVLSLRSNLFVGDIPAQLCMLSSLHILDLAENNFSGRIPHCIGNLSGMTYILTSERYEGQLSLVAKGRFLLYENTLYLVNLIDLSRNNLSGMVPETICNMSSLGTLNLSTNHLTGAIPDRIGELKRLETLDLSSNQLSGIIPTSMALITSLNHLNLSHNNLSGRIPSTNQFQTFNDPSIYEGNPGLCGPPLPRKCEGDEVQTSPPPASENMDDQTGEDHEMLGFFISMVIGFFAGFWVVCGTLIINQAWRYAYFRSIDRVTGWIVKVLHVS